MSLKSFVTTLVLLGSSTAALADPSFSFGASASVGGSVDIRDHRVNDWRWIRDHRHPVEQPGVVMQPVAITDQCANVRIGPTSSKYIGPIGYAAQGRWITLVQPTKIGHKGEEIDVGTDKGRFRSLQLVPVNGATYINDVVVEFGNGEYQRVSLDRTLTSSTRIDLNIHSYRGRAIKRIIVEGSSGFGSRYSILAA